MNNKSYCKNCGAELKQGDVFCSGCGCAVTAEQTQDSQQYFADNQATAQPVYVTGAGTAAKKKISNKMIGIIICASVVLVVIIGIIIVCISCSNSYKNTLDKYFKSYENNDPNLMYSSVFAQYWIDYMNADSSNAAFESIQDIIEDTIEEWNCGDDIKITYNINSEKRATKEELEDLEYNIYDWYAYYVYERNEFSITDAYVLDISFTVEGDKRSDDFYYPDGFLIIKENGKWKVPRGSIATSFYDNQ